jgi:hypothetical protein
VSSSWRKYWGRCKSRLSAIARSCFLGRERWHKNFSQLQAQVRELEHAVQSNEQLKLENERLKARVAELEEKLTDKAAPRPSRWEEPPLPGHSYSASMMELCVNLARSIGLRPTSRALRIVVAWLGIECQIPVYQTLRIWMERIGLDRMQRARKVNDGIWLVDHTQQLGKEKALVVLRVRQLKLPPPGAALKHKDVEVLAVMPGKQWQSEDVDKVYQELAERCGTPLAVLSDGASELREPIKSLGKPGHRPLAIRDMKHFLASQLKAILHSDARYEQFRKRVGKMHCLVHQTELAQFEPPRFKLKERFMNFAPMLNWAGAVLWHLEHPASKGRQKLSPGALEEKFGWLRDFTIDIRHWQECQNVISAAQRFANEQGIFQGAAKEFRKLARPLVTCSASRRLARTTIKFLKSHEKGLKRHQRLPMSTEVLESSFGRYKQFEQQHATAGFSSLLLTFATLLRPTTHKQIHASFGRVKVADVQKWIKTHLPDTLTAKRHRMYRESRNGKISATSKLVTT